MVYCRYCGAKNRDGDLRCTQCNKPLSLIPDNSPSRPSSRSNNSSNFNNRSSNYNNNRNSNNQNSPIKNKYLEKDQKLNEFRNNNSNLNIPPHQSRNQKNTNSLHPQNSNNSNIRENRENNYNDINPNMRNQSFQNYQNTQKYSNNPNMGHDRENNFPNRREYREIDKTAVEWDVVIVTALIVIILTAILHRLFLFFAIFISLLIGLAFILVAIKLKSSLFKSIPLAVLAILAISAYFSI
ncbi:hypothetical protein ALNOE001_14420 [Candidatus Methanobinarius endosymbioticus]|uniref:Zinc-ribbon domain-containing protein n=1 Tax=Candidatus Methanobinarius endosymbioticus TaxID=2006182 RepID=A0A366M9E9_9EURY|nr:hypothetical protein ALNOE001_14420 [Candidatus Methanobinarius endosymbioticus]